MGATRRASSSKGSPGWSRMVRGDKGVGPNQVWRSGAMRSAEAVRVVRASVLVVSTERMVGEGGLRSLLAPTLADDDAVGEDGSPGSLPTEDEDVEEDGSPGYMAKAGV